MGNNHIVFNRFMTSVGLIFIAALSLSAKEHEDNLDIQKQESKDVVELIPAINLVNISTNQRSMALGGLSNIVREKAFGVQIGGLYNHIGSMGRGVAIAGLGNTVLGSYYGMQMGGLWSYNAEDSKGLMMGGLGNVAGDGFEGMQLAGLANIAEEMKGVQLAGLVNISQDVYGLQFSGLTNVAKDVYGLQFAGLVNVAKDVYGLRFAGLVNVAKRVKGVQFASILNVAEESNCPIGLINIVKNGSMGVALTYDVMGNALVSFRSGGRYTYGIIGVGCNQQTIEKIVAEAGYGVHIPVCEWLQVNNEVKATSPINTSSVNFGYLLAPSITLWEHCNLFGGASVNYLMSDTNLDFVPGYELWDKQSADGVQRLYIGYQVGVQYVF
ncbi:MAG: hypothetical protein IKT86_00735 [Bacteroidaceae bacterium]|nr:hypothetical protein [Bacteroidaceae bacterium]